MYFRWIKDINLRGQIYKENMEKIQRKFLRKHTTVWFLPGGNRKTSRKRPKNTNAMILKIKLVNLILSN